MQNRYFAIAFLLFILPVANLIAQCVPDSSITGAYAPSQQQGLPSGSVSVPYEAIITIKVPADTSLGPLTVNVDSLKLQDVVGLPEDFSYDCSTVTCAFAGGTYGCIRIFGTANDAEEAGTYDIEADFLFYTSLGTIPYTIDDYSIELDTSALGVKQIDNNQFKFAIEPNPITAASKLIYQLPGNGVYTIDVYSLLGNNVSHFQAQPISTEMKFSLSEFSKVPGVYFITLKQGMYSRSLRFIVR